MNKLLTILLLLYIGYTHAQTTTNAPVDNNKISMEDKILGLSLLWKEAAYNFAYFERLPNLNWNKEYSNYMVKVLETKSDLEYYLVLQDFINLLKEGHTRVVMPQNMMKQYYEKIKKTWFYFDWVGDDVYVTACRLAINDHLPIGSKIIEINDLQTKKYFEVYFSHLLNTFFEHTFKSKLTFMFIYEFENYPKKIKFSTPAGEIRYLAFDTIVSENKKWTKFTDFDMQRDMRKSPTLSWVDKDIAYFDLAGDMDDNLLHFFDSIYPSLKKAKGIVMDLRYSNGGSDVGSRIAMHFSQKDTVSQYIYSRTNDANKRAFGAYADSACIAFIGGQKRHFENAEYYADTKFELDSFCVVNNVPKENRVKIPLVFLIDNNVGSATEGFLIDIKSLNIGTIVGEPTAGSCTQPLVVMLPGGGVGMIASQKTMLNKDEVFTYINPDVLVKRTIEEILAGKDKIYEEGLRVLKEKIAKK